jgi:hypothetical protein
MGNFALQTGPCSFLKLRISPWGVSFPFLLYFFSPWRLLLFFLHWQLHLLSPLPPFLSSAQAPLLSTGGGCSGLGEPEAGRAAAAQAGGSSVAATAAGERFGRSGSRRLRRARSRRAGTRQGAAPGAGADERRALARACAKAGSRGAWALVATQKLERRRRRAGERMRAAVGRGSGGAGPAWTRLGAGRRWAARTVAALVQRLEQSTRWNRNRRRASRSGCTARFGSATACAGASSAGQWRARCRRCRRASAGAGPERRRTARNEQ